MTEEELIAQQSANREGMSPGERFVADIEAAKAAEQKQALDQQAEDKWRSMPAKPDIDYKGAYAAGSDFSTGPVPSRFVNQKPGPGYFGHDQNGKPVKGEFNDPAFTGPLRDLADTPVASNPLAGVESINLDNEQSVRAAGNLADAANTRGMPAAEFSANLPPSVPPEVKEAAWESARERSFMRGAGPKLMRMQQVPIETKPADFEVDEVRQMPEFIDAGKVLYERRTGEKFTGSDAEAADWLVSTMRDIDLNVIGQAAVLNDLNRGYSAQVKPKGRAAGMGVQAKEGSAPEATPDAVYAAYGTAFDIWDRTAMEMDVWEQTKNLGRVIADPTNLLGLGYGKVAATTAFRTTIKQLTAAGMEKGAKMAALKEAAKQADVGKVAAVGAAGGAIGEGNLELTKTLASDEKGADGQRLTGGEVLGQTAGAAAVGGAAGAVLTPALNEMLLLGGKLVKDAWRKSRGGAEAPTDAEMDAVIGNILRDRAEGRATGDIEAGWGDINNLLDNTLSAHNPRNVVYDGLIKTGMDEGEAAANATVVGTWYETAAKHYNVTPEELFRHMPMEIRGDNALADVTPTDLSQAKPAITPGDRPGAVNVTGVHFSREQRDVLSGEHYGTGMRGAESRSVDPNTPRLFFYADQGGGVRPETGVGSIGHEVDLTNIYDLTTDPLRLRRETAGETERAVMESNYDGYMTRDMFPAEDNGTRQAGVVLLGDAARNVPTRPRSGTRAGAAPTPKRSDMHTAFRTFADDYSLPAMATPAEFGRRLAAKNPELHAKLEKTGVFKDDTTKVYRSDLTGMADDPEAFAAYPRAASFDDFKPENVKNILNRSDWAILTAENPKGVPASPEENAARMAALKADLDAKGIQYKEVKGKYGGEENSLLLTGVTKKQASEIGAAYDQDSVLTREGLTYQDGSVNPATGEVDVFDTPPDDFYTTVRNDDGSESYFAVGIDFDKKVDGVFNQSVSLRKRTEAVDDALEQGGQTATPAFKKWFAGSKIVDADGKPRVMYRGQDSDFNKSPLENRYFTSDPAYAADYVDPAWGDSAWARGNVLPVYIRAENIYMPDDVNDVTDYSFDRESLIAQGYDAIATKDLEIVVPLKESSQIKSAVGNKGTFDPANPDILEQGPKGTYNPGKALVTLFETADQSTFAHESAHHFLEMTTKMASSPGAPAAIVKDFDKVLNWFGVTKDEWLGMSLEQKRPFHERYAQGFEQYLRNGTAPTNALKRVFAQFKDWLTAIYKESDELGLPISDDVRGVFDRMLGGKGSQPGAISSRFRVPLPVVAHGADGALNQFAGEKHKMSPLVRVDLYRAKTALDSGASADQVRQDTGWFKGRDGKMRYEIDDSKMTIKEDAFPAQQPEGGIEAWLARPRLVSDLIDHPDLFRAYPDVANIVVDMRPDLEARGTYAPAGDAIELRADKAQVALTKAQASTLMHEIQHAIQTREGFARGGSARSMRWDDFSPEWQTKITESRERARRWHARDDFYRRDKAMDETYDLERRAQYDAYQRLLGEVEARDTQKRLDYDAGTRMLQSPDQPADAIIKWGNTEISASYHQEPTPGQIRTLNDAADAILEGDTVKLLRDALEADPEMPGKYISTGTINTERLHPGAAMAKDPGRFVGQIENAEDLAKLMEYIGEGLELSEPPRTHAEIARTATLMDLEPLLRGEQTGLASDRQLYAMRSMVATLGDQTVELARKIRDGDHTAETGMKYEQVGRQLIAMQKLLTGNVREVARALSQQRMIATVLDANDIKALERTFLDNSPGAIQRNAEALIQNIENGEDPLKALAKGLKRRTWLEASVEFWTASILTAPPTHMVNVTSGLILDAWHLGIVKPIAGAIGSTKGLAGMQKQDRITLSESVASAVAGSQGIWDGLSAMMNVLKTGESEMFGYGAGKVDAPKGALATKMTELIGPNGEVVADVANVAFRLLQAEDELFKTIAYRSEVAGLATRQAIGAGLEGDAIKAHIAKVMADVPDDIHHAALNKADELTLQDSKMGSGVIGGVAYQVRKVVQQYPALKFLMPFITTPVNVVVTSIENSALAAVSPKLWRDMLAGGAAADMAQAKIVAGTALTAAAWGLYEAGLLTGNGPEDWEQRKLLEQTGWQPNSIRVGDTFIEINRLDPPIGGVLASVAGAFDRATFARRELDPVLEFSGAIAAFGERTLQLPFLQGVKDLVDLTQSGLPGVAALTAKTAGGFVPYSAMTAAVARTGDVDTGIKAISREKTVGLGGQGVTDDLVQAASQQIRSRLPFARDGLRPARNWDGEVIMPDAGKLVSMVSPLRVKADKGDTLTNELVANGIGFSEAPPAVTLAGVTFSVLEMDHNQGLAYDRMLKRIGEARREAVREVVESSEYEDAVAGPGSERAVALQAAMTAGKQAGTMQFLTEDLPAMLAAGEIDPNAIAEQVGGDLEGFLEQALEGTVTSQRGARFDARGARNSKPIVPSGSGVPRL